MAYMDKLSEKKREVVYKDRPEKIFFLLSTYRSFVELNSSTGF